MSSAIDCSITLIESVSPISRLRSLGRKRFRHHGKGGRKGKPTGPFISILKCLFSQQRGKHHVGPGLGVFRDRLLGEIGRTAFQKASKLLRDDSLGPKKIRDRDASQFIILLLHCSIKHASNLVPMSPK